MAGFRKADANIAEVTGYAGGLLVSSYGAVFRPSGRKVAQWPDRYGYLHVTVRCVWEIFSAPVHALVAHCFIGPRPMSLSINHIDGDKRHNAADNLEYLSIADNARHAGRLGLRRGKRNANAKLTDDYVRDIRRRYAQGETQCALARRFGITQVQVSHIVRRTRGGWPHIG